MTQRQQDCSVDSPDSAGESADPPGELQPRDETVVPPEVSESDAGVLPPCLDRDTVFEMLSARRRRFVLTYLLYDAGGQATVPEVAKQVAAWEQGVSPASLSYDDRKSVHISIYQHHAPKMADAGLISFDKRTKTMTLTDSARELKEFLVESNESEESNRVWGYGFLALTLLGVGGMSFGLLGTLPSLVSSLGLLALFVLLQAGLSMSVAYLVRHNGRPDPGANTPARGSGSRI